MDEAPAGDGVRTEPAHPDWLAHALTASGPAEALAALRAAAAGAGGIPWHDLGPHDPGLDLWEEDRMFSLVQPPDGSPGLRIAAARVLARQLRDAMESHQHRVRAASEARVKACPFDLHALVPVPDAVLRRGPGDPHSLAWLRAHWGTTRALRHVRIVGDPRSARHGTEWRVRFWSADWTPWQAFAAIRARWPALAFEVRPLYRDDADRDDAFNAADRDDA